MNNARDLLAQGRAEEALAEVNTVLSQNPRDVEALLLRSTLSIRTGDFGRGLADAEEAVRTSKGSPESQLRRAISLWRLGEFGKAKGVAHLLDGSQAAAMWRSMIEARAEKEEPVDRIPAAHTTSPASSNGGGSTASGPSTTSNKSASAVASAVPSVGTPTNKTQPLVAPQAPRMDWYQSNNTVHVVLYRKGLDKEKALIKISETELVVSDGEFSWTQALGHAIDVDKSTYEHTPYKVEFSLRKRKPVQWTGLDSSGDSSGQSPRAADPGTEVVPEPSPAPAAAASAKPLTTSYSKWDNIDVDDGEEEASGDPNAFFQQLYKSSTPDVQRAMMKSFVESNGTALSTNWDEVKKGKVETQAPKDMEAREWK